MNKQEKINTIFGWLKAGYAVKICGNHRDTMWIDEKYIHVWHYGSYAINKTKTALKNEYECFCKYDDVDFYIIDNNGKMRCTDEAMENYCNTTINTFKFHHRHIMSNTIDKKPLFVKHCTIAEMMANMLDIAEEYSKAHSEENIVHYVVNRENDNGNFPMWNSWNFAV